VQVMGVSAAVIEFEAREPQEGELGHSPAELREFARASAPPTKASESRGVEAQLSL
jgi:hypothetical protein